MWGAGFDGGRGLMGPRGLSASQGRLPSWSVSRWGPGVRAEPVSAVIVSPKRAGGRLQSLSLTDKKAWTMSALMELSGLSLMTTKICSSFSRLMKFPNHDFLASLGDGGGGAVSGHDTLCSL